MLQWITEIQSMRAQSLSRVQFFATLCTVAHQTPLSMGLPRQEWVATKVGCHFLLQAIVLTQGLNTCFLCLLHCRLVHYPLSCFPDGARGIEPTC